MGVIVMSAASEHQEFLMGYAERLDRVLHSNASFWFYGASEYVDGELIVNYNFNVPNFAWLAVLYIPGILFLGFHWYVFIPLILLLYLPLTSGWKIAWDLKRHVFKKYGIRLWRVR